MKQIFQNIIVIIVLAGATLVAAQEQTAPQNNPPQEKKIKDRQYYVESYSGRNPFLPQLPVAQTDKPENVGSEKTDPNIPDPVSPRLPDVPKPPEIVPPKLDITGIVWNTNRPQAIINGQVVDEGDTILEATIVSISKTQINISFKGKDFTFKP